MQINLNIKDSDLKCKWVTYFEDIEFKINYLSEAKINSISQLHTKTRWNRGSQVEDTDYNKVANDMFVYMVEDWKGFEDTIGQVLECNEKNKLLFKKNFGSQMPPGMKNKISTYGDFITDYARDINNYVNIEKEEKEVKNL